MRGLRVLPLSALLALAIFTLGGATYAGTLDRMRQENLIRLAYRADAPPFSYTNQVGDPAGYMVELCEAVVKRLSQQLNLPTLSTKYLVVSADDRFEAIQHNKADLLCEPTSVTLSRRELVDFSVATSLRVLRSSCSVVVPVRTPTVRPASSCRF